MSARNERGCEVAQVESEENRKVADCWPVYIYTRIQGDPLGLMSKRGSAGLRCFGEKGSRVKRTELNSLLVKEGEG